MNSKCQCADKSDNSLATTMKKVLIVLLTAMLAFAQIDPGECGTS
ncbi:MAG: hypothetical protein ABSD30_22845 [Candidatus Binatus sp.]|jgi:hypothetical protein